jgi:hypothetical protein
VQRAVVEFARKFVDKDPENLSLAFFPLSSDTNKSLFVCQHNKDFHSFDPEAVWGFLQHLPMKGEGMDTLKRLHSPLPSHHRSWEEGIFRSMAG